MPVALTILQMLFTCVALMALPALRNSLHFGSSTDVWRWARAMPPLFALMLTSSVFALQNCSLGAVVVVRSITPLPTLAIEALCGERVRVDVSTLLALSIGVAGVLLYSSQDMHFSPAGLCWLGVNTVAAVAERLLQRRMLAVSPVDVSTTGKVLLSNGIGALLLVPLCVACGEPRQLGPVISNDELGVEGWAVVLLSCVVGMAISYAGINVQRLVSATTVLVLNNSNKFAVVAFGALCT